MTFPEWLEVAALLVLSVGIAWALGVLAAPYGMGWPVALVVLALLLLGIARLLDRRFITGGGR